MCNPPSPHCYFDECDSCPKTEKLQEYLTTSLEETKSLTSNGFQLIDPHLKLTVLPLKNLLTYYARSLELLRSHSFIASEQAVLYANCKEMLKVGVFLVTADFSENYSFVLQDDA